MMTEQIEMSDLAIPPGEYLEEVLAAMDISQVELPPPQDGTIYPDHQ